MANECNQCGDPPGPGSVARWIGRDGTGKEVELCSRCLKTRLPDTTPQPLQLPLKKKAKKR